MLLLLRRFIREERGVVSLWLLLWSFLFIAFAGLAVDVSNAMRMRAMLQATSDASSHAGVVALLAGDDMDGVAIAVSRQIMGASENGSVVVADDVDAGWWDATNRVFYWSDPGAGVNTRRAVRVVASRENATDKESVPTSLLRILDYENWNIAAVSVATAGGGLCTGAENRVITPSTITFTANNTFGGELCLFGREGISGTQNNVGAGVVFLMNDPDTAQNKEAIDADNHGWFNPDCSGCEPRRAEMPSDFVATFNSVLDRFINGTGDPMFNSGDGDVNFKTPYTWDSSQDRFEDSTGAEVALEDPDGNPLSNVFSSADYIILPSHKNGNNDLVASFEAAYTAGARNFYIHCQQTDGEFQFTSGYNISGVNIFSGDNPETTTGQPERPCTFKGAGLILDDVRIATESTQDGTGNNASINLNGQPSAPAQACLANPEDGLELYTKGGVDFTAQSDMESVRIWAGGVVSFTAGTSISHFVDIVALGEVTMTANQSITPRCPEDGTTQPLSDEVVVIVD